MRADLHVHTYASDGMFSPAEILALARDTGLGAIAITDHDTTEGVRAALAERAAAPLIIPGIELSAEDRDTVTGQRIDVHMLGYFLDADDADLQAHLSRFREDRLIRAQRIVERFDELGMPISWDHVVEIAESGGKGGTIGRPHVARALVDAGYVATVREAFERFLYTGGPAYIPRQRISPEEAIALIHDAHGAAVLAHPGALPAPLVMIKRLVPAGLDGVEVYHPKNSFNLRLDLRGVARQLELVVTGGSDFHGGAVSDIRLGSETLPDDVLPRLRERAERYRSGTH